MSDPRITKLAQVLVHYSLELKPGDQFMMHNQPVGPRIKPGRLRRSHQSRRTRHVLQSNARRARNFLQTCQ